MTSDNPPGTVSRLPLVIGGGIVVAIVMLAVALLVGRGPKVYEPGTPEATIQNFVQAELDGDTEAMLETLTERLRNECGDSIEQWGDWWPRSNDGTRVELEQIEISGDEAHGVVLIRRSNSADPFDNSSWDNKAKFDLVKLDGDWLIDDSSWVYFEDCKRGLG